VEKNGHGSNLDKPQRARKTGNEYIEGQTMKKRFSGFLIN
jgi:hypothetical protein